MLSVPVGAVLYVRGVGVFETEQLGENNILCHYSISVCNVFELYRYLKHDSIYENTESFGINKIYIISVKLSKNFANVLK